MELLVLTNGKDESYNSIFIIVNPLIKIVHYQPVKISIDTPTTLAKVIINIIV